MSPTTVEIFDGFTFVTCRVLRVRTTPHSHRELLIEWPDGELLYELVP